jgi:hypothetical protein
VHRGPTTQRSQTEDAVRVPVAGQDLGASALAAGKLNSQAVSLALAPLKTRLR